MKVAIKISLVLSLCISQVMVGKTQEAISKKYKEDVIHTLSNLMNERYVFPEVAKKTEAHLLEQFKKGHFDKYSNDVDFAKALTESVQSINKDKHMKIWKNPPYEAPDNSPERMIEERLFQMNRSRNYNAGFNSVKVMEGNVGYLDLRGFAGKSSGKLAADAYMELLSNTDAIILDMSKNGGGDPEMVQYLCSFFFEDKVHLNSLYFREGDRTIDFWTLEEVDGDKMPDVPLFVLTSERTFSGAEEFSYNMQTQKRATLIGQTTGGGANPGGSMGINENLTVFIPTGMAINPITKTNWEGVGVVPEIVTTVVETLEKAHELAMKAAEDHRKAKAKKYTKVFMDLSKKMESYSKESSDKEILEGIKVCIESKLLGEGDINMMGYEYLMGYEKPLIAQSIFKANTVLYPNSPNVYDSYAESLMMNGDLDGSILNYKKAIEVAVKNDDRDVEFYRENLAKVIKMKEGK